MGEMAGSHLRLKGTFNFRIFNLPSSYLGAPLLFGTPRKQHFEGLLASIRRKLSGWRANSLAFAAQLVLVRHVLSGMSLHITMVLPMTKSICSLIESCMRNFLWSGGEFKEKANFVSSAKVWLPKSEGGLGLRQVHEMNSACFIKLVWRAISSSSLWASWFQSSYLKKGLPLSILSNSSGSYIWKKMKGLARFLMQGILWRIGNDCSVNMWFDRWLLDCPLSSIFFMQELDMNIYSSELHHFKELLAALQYQQCTCESLHLQ